MAESNRFSRLASEAFVIVGSILLAFWIDAWWEDRQAREAEAAALEAVRLETDENHAALDEIIATNEERMDRIDRFVRSTPEALRDLPEDSVSPWLTSIAIAWTYDADLSATRLFLDAGAPVTPLGGRVRALAAEWIRQLEDAEEERESLWSIGLDLSKILSTLALESAPDGITFVNGMAARQGTSGLSRLRADREFVAAVLDKAHYQRIYMLELQWASEVLDSLRFAFR